MSPGGAEMNGNRQGHNGLARPRQEHGEPVELRQHRRSRLVPGWRGLRWTAGAVAATLAAVLIAPAGALAAAPVAAHAPASSQLRSWSGYVRSTDGVRLWVHSVGGGAAHAQVVIVVHGGPGLSLGYLAIFDRLASPARQIVSYDQRGAGRSTQPADHNYSIAAQVADLEAVRHWTGDRRVTILGHSWGGIPAAAYTATYPAHVAALVLMDALPLSWAEFIAGENRLGKRITTLQGEGLIPNPLPPITHNSCLAHDQALTPAYVANPLEHVSPAIWGPSCNWRTALRTFTAFINEHGQLPTLAAALGQWPGRALVLQGAEDPFGLQWLHTSVAELRSATVQHFVVNGAGHFPWVERPKAVLAAVSQFTG
jgi:proline iminopeptidase